MMSKSYWITLAVFSLVLNIFLFNRGSKNCDFNSFKILDRRGKEVKVGDLKGQLKLFLIMPENPACKFGLTEPAKFLQHLANYKKNAAIGVYVIIPPNEKNQLLSKNFIKVYHDKNYVFIRTAGYFQPSIYLIDKDGKLLLIVPIPKNVNLSSKLMQLTELVIQEYLRLN